MFFAKSTLPKISFGDGVLVLFWELRYSISMKVVEINSVAKEEGYIYYLNRYTGTAVLDILSSKVNLPVSFSIEINPLGMRNIEIDSLPADLNYPVMPVKKALKVFIDNMYKQGELPQV